MKTFIVGIDSLDITLVDRFIEDLPNLAKLRNQSPKFDLKSVYPPDSVTCWSSIYTGWNPARHGLLFFSDPLDKVATTTTTDVDNTVLRGKSFWDFAGREGKSVCLLFPHVCYPVWQVSGVMMGRSSSILVKKSVESYPREIREQFKDMALESIKAYPENPERFLKRAEELIVSESKVALTLYKKQEWDLFFVYSGTLDFISHHFWSSFDEGDPSYEQGPNSAVIPKFYKLYDAVIGEYLKAMTDDTVAIIISDHGHGRRPSNTVNLNMILKDQGLLNTRDDRRGGALAYGSLEAVKGMATSSVNKYRRGGNLAMRALKRFPRLRRFFTKSWLVDWDRTLAYTVDMSGLKAYTYGGIRLLRGKLADSYEPTRASILANMKTLKVPGQDVSLFKWIARREDVYNGPFIEKYPDIIFEMVEDYGAGHKVAGPLFSKSQTHNIQPGSHKPDSPTLLISGHGGTPNTTEVGLVDIAPTLLRIMGVSPPIGLDGKSIY